jgi:hypothetical protein
MLPSGVWVYFILLPNEEDSLLIRFWCAIQVGKKFPHWLEGSVQWYGTLCITITTHNMVVSEYEYADLTTKSR